MLLTPLARKLLGNPEFLGCILRKISILEGYLRTRSFQTYIKKKTPKSNHATKKMVKVKLERTP